MDLKKILNFKRIFDKEPGVKESTILRESTILKESATLNSLPAEVAIRIAECLPPSSAVTFALCSKTLFIKIGRLCIDRFKKSLTEFNTGPQIIHTARPEWGELLELLERDCDEDKFFCYHCSVIHGAYVRYGRGCSRIYVSPVAERFSFAAAHIAMRRHRAGKDPQFYLRLLSGEETFKDRSINYSQNCEARIVQDNLFIRTQHCFDAPKELCEENFRTRINWAVCAHVDSHPSSFDLCSSLGMPLGVSIASDLRRALRRPDRSGPVHSCDRCVTEHQVRVVNYWGERRKFLVTAWHDLGQLDSVFGEEWRSHFQKRRDSSGLHSRSSSWRNNEGASRIWFTKGFLQRRWDNAGSPQARLLKYLRSL